MPTLAAETIGYPGGASPYEVEALSSAGDATVLGNLVVPTNAKSITVGDDTVGVHAVIEKNGMQIRDTAFAAVGSTLATVSATAGSVNVTSQDSSYTVDLIADNAMNAYVAINGNKVLADQQPAIADATDAASAITQLNLALAALRTHGVIAT